MMRGSFADLAAALAGAAALAVAVGACRDERGARAPLPEEPATVEVTGGPYVPPAPGAAPLDDAVLPPAATPNAPVTAGTDEATSAREQDSDRAISTRIRQEMVQDESAAAAMAKVQVVTREGRVTLRGTVTDGGQQARVLAAVRRVPEVVAIDDQLEVGGK